MRTSLEELILKSANYKKAERVAEAGEKLLRKLADATHLFVERKQALYPNARKALRRSTNALLKDVKKAQDLISEIPGKERYRDD